MKDKELARELDRRGVCSRETIKECWKKISPNTSFQESLIEAGAIHSEELDRLTGKASDAKALQVTAVSQKSGAIEICASRPCAVPQSIDAHNSWDEVLVYAREHDASDVHFSARKPLMLRRSGLLELVGKMPLSPERMEEILEDLLSEENMLRLREEGDLDGVYTIPASGRYRVTFVKQRAGFDATVRVIPSKIRSFEDLGLPESCKSLIEWSQGMILVTGPAGCGKTATLTTLIEMINRDRTEHIITIEDPIEFIFENKKSRFTQRQISKHTADQESALRAALRQDPDIIVISELRDLASMKLAISAAETGHLVLGTMNTTNASRTLYRLVDPFPPEEQDAIRSMVSESLRGIICQRMVPRADGKGIAMAFETMMVTTAVSNMIRKNEMHQLASIMLMGRSSGMQILDHALLDLVEAGTISGKSAAALATTPAAFQKYLEN